MPADQGAPPPLLYGRHPGHPAPIPQPGRAEALGATRAPFSADTRMTETPSARTALTAAGGIEADPVRAAKVLALRDATGETLSTSFINANLDEVADAVARGQPAQDILKKQPGRRGYIRGDPARGAVRGRPAGTPTTLSTCVKLRPRRSASSRRWRGPGPWHDWHFGTVYSNLARPAPWTGRQGISQDVLDQQIARMPNGELVAGARAPRAGGSRGLAGRSRPAAPAIQFARTQQILRDEVLDRHSKDGSRA